MFDILLIGDSLTQWNYNTEIGWGYKMKQWYAGKANIHNKGFAGYSSTMIKNIFHEFLLGNPQIICVTILLGTNDCHGSETKVSPAEYKQNLAYMIETIHNINHLAVILLITPPITEHNNDNILHYVNVVRELCYNQLRIRIVDLHSGKNDITLADLYDGVHINESGNIKLYEHIKDTLHTYYDCICPDKLFCT